MATAPLQAPSLSRNGLRARRPAAKPAPRQGEDRYTNRDRKLTGHQSAHQCERHHLPETHRDRRETAERDRALLAPRGSAAHKSMGGTAWPTHAGQAILKTESASRGACRASQPAPRSARHHVGLQALRQVPPLTRRSGPRLVYTWTGSSAGDSQRRGVAENKGQSRRGVAQTSAGIEGTSVPPDFFPTSRMTRCGAGAAGPRPAGCEPQELVPCHGTWCQRH